MYNFLIGLTIFHIQLRVQFVQKLKTRKKRKFFINVLTALKIVFLAFAKIAFQQEITKVITTFR